MGPVGLVASVPVERQYIMTGWEIERLTSWLGWEREGRQGRGPLFHASLERWRSPTRQHFPLFSPPLSLSLSPLPSPVMYVCVGLHVDVYTCECECTCMFVYVTVEVRGRHWMYSLISLS